MLPGRGKNRKTYLEWILVVEIPENHVFPTAKPPKRQGKTSKTESHREWAPDSVQKVPRTSGSRLEWARASGKIEKTTWSVFLVAVISENHVFLTAETTKSHQKKTPKTECYREWAPEGLRKNNCSDLVAQGLLFRG